MKLLEINLLKRVLSECEKRFTTDEILYFKDNRKKAA